MSNSIIYHVNNSSGRPLFTISADGNIGIGTDNPSTPLILVDEWLKIHNLANTNESVKIALDMLKTTYYLAKNNGSKT